MFKNDLQKSGSRMKQKRQVDDCTFKNRLKIIIYHWYIFFIIFKYIYVLYIYIYIYILFLILEYSNERDICCHN